MVTGGWYTWFVSFTAALGGLLFGYEIGIINSVLNMDPFQLFFGLRVEQKGMLKEIEGLSESRSSNIVSFFVLGCIPGALFLAFAADYLGRKRSIWLGCLFFNAGALLQTFVPASLSVDARIGFMMAGRFFGGLGVGILSMSVPLFIAEVAPTEIRGRLTAIQQLMITIGITIASVVNTIIINIYQNKRMNNDFQWRLALGIQSAPGFLLIVMLFFIPESPRWLLSKERDEDALTSLARLRQTNERSPVVIDEYQSYKQALQAEMQVGTAEWSELLRPGIRNRVIIGVILQFFQQWTGINAVMYYSSSLYISMGIDKYTATTVLVIVQNLVNAFGTLPGMYLIERVGRTKLLIWGGFTMATCMWGLTLFVNLFQNASNFSGTELTEEIAKSFPPQARTFSIIGVIFMYFYVLAFASTWGPVVWVYQSEIFPARVRGKCAGIATASNWINNFILAFIWPHASKLKANQYIVFGVSGILMSLYVLRQVPETKGRSIEEMDKLFGFESDEEYMEKKKELQA